MRLKWGQTEYKGRLISVDSYMNIQLNETEEFIDLKSTGTLGQVLIRCVFSWDDGAVAIKADGNGAGATMFCGYQLRKMRRTGTQRWRADFEELVLVAGCTRL